MDNPERPSNKESRFYLAGIRFLIQKAREGTANSFPLFGPLFGPQEEPAKVFQCLALYPVNFFMEETILAIPDQGYRNYLLLQVVVDLCSRAGNVDLGIEDDPSRRRVSEIGFSLLPFPVPSILLILGETPTNEPATRLYSLPGISPATALSEIQEAANQALKNMAEKN